MPLSLRTCFLRLVVAVGATIGVALMVIAVITVRRSPHRAVSIRDRVFCGRAGSKIRLLGVECSDTEKRNLKDATYPLSGGENHEWPSHEDHYHRDHDYHDFDDNHTDDDDDSDDNNRESASIQSGILTNMDGVNIGNTITIININSGNQSSGSGSADDPYYSPNGRTPNNYGISDNDRSAITSAAVRAFCTSLRCNPSYAAETTTNSANVSTIPSVNGGNIAARDNKVQYGQPMKTNGSSGVKTVTWLLLVAILVQLHHI